MLDLVRLLRVGQVFRDECWISVLKDISVEFLMYFGGFCM